MTTIAASDTLSFKVLGDAHLSTVGNNMCYTVSESFRVKGESRARSSIWIRGIRDGLSYCSSSGLITAYDPKWSSDSTKLGFIGQETADSVPQLYLFHIGSGRLLQLTHLEGEIEQFEWSGDDSKIVLLMKEKPKISGDPEEYEEELGFSNLYFLELSSGYIDQISSGYQVWDFAISPDSKHVAAVISHEPHEWAWHISHLALIEVSKKTLKTLLEPAPRQIGALKWSPDGNEIYYISSIISDRGLIGGDLFRVIPSSKSTPLKVTGDSLGTIHSYDFVNTNQLVILSINMAQVILSVLDLKQSQIKPIIMGKYDFWVNPWYQPQFSLNPSMMKLAIVREDTENQQEIWIGEIVHNSVVWTQETHFNANQKDLLRGNCQLVEWKSFDGEMIQGLLHTPSKRKEKLPLIVNIHGGPSLSYGYRFEARTKFFLNRGFSVLLPNPRGSTGRGIRFSEMNRGNVDGKDFEDIRAGVDYLVKSDLADPSNLFIMGASYGGYMVAWAITHSKIFNAAIMNYGISNLMSCHGGEWNTFWDEFIFDINPYKDPQKYHMKSPINYVKDVKTPTLIMHGKEDPCVPVTQGIELFRALKELGIETKLIIYPREKHGWSEREHITDALERQAQWFADHLKKEE